MGNTIALPVVWVLCSFDKKSVRSFISSCFFLILLLLLFNKVLLQSQTHVQQAEIAAKPSSPNSLADKIEDPSRMCYPLIVLELCCHVLN